MERVETVHAEILMVVRGFSVEEVHVCTDLAILEVDRCVQKCTCSADQVAVNLMVGW